MNTRTRVATVMATALLAVPALAACGGGDKPEKTVEGYFHALGDKNTKDACKFMTTKDGKKSLADDADQLKTCTEGLADLVKSAKKDDLNDMKNAKIKGSEVDGDTAKIKADQVEGMDNSGGGSVSLVKIDGTWLIDSKKMSQNN